MPGRAGVLAGDVDDTGPPPDRASGPQDTDPAERLRRRRDGIEARTRQLQERVRELAERRRRGPRPDEAERAREHAAEAQEHARTAHERAAVSHEEAADVHLRVADVLDHLGQVDRAREHRAAAAADRGHAMADRQAADRTAVRRDAEEPR